MAVEWGTVIVLLVLASAIVMGVANRRTRPYVFGLGIVACVMVVWFVRRPTWQDEPATVEPPPPEVRSDAPLRANSPIAASPAPSPPKSTAAESKQPKMTLLAALRQATVQAWTGQGPPPSAAALEKPAKTSQRVVRNSDPDDPWTGSDAPAKPGESGQPAVPPKPRSPDWVSAPPKMEDNAYRMSVHVGPYTTDLECRRELPRALQEAVAEYAELSFGPEAAAVRLPDDDLLKLVRDRWTEVRPMEIGGGSQDMHTLHALVVIDAAARQRIQRSMIFPRVEGAALIFAAVIGLLALTWGGLRWAAKRPQLDGPGGPQGPQGQIPISVSRGQERAASARITVHFSPHKVPFHLGAIIVLAIIFVVLVLGLAKLLIVAM
jgi:hypothetical protein